MEYDECMFYAINSNQIYWLDRLKDQPFVFPKLVEQVFFCANWLKLGQLIVYKTILGYLGFFGKLPLAWDDGSHVVGSSCMGIF